MYLLAGEALLLPDVVGLRDRVIRVGEQREREVVLGLELRVRGLLVGADAQHDGAGALERGPPVADVAGLPCAAGRVVLGIEVEDDRLAAQRRQADLLAAVARQREVRRRACPPRPCRRVYPAGVATLAGMRRFVADMNPTVRGLIADRDSCRRRSWRSRPSRRSSSSRSCCRSCSSSRSRSSSTRPGASGATRSSSGRSAPALSFYGGAGLILADIGAYWYDRPSGPAALAFFLVLGVCGFAMFRVWRDQHTYS